jgi:hypothetical protein
MLLVTPWRPPLYAFQVIHLTRPAESIELSPSFHSLVESATCCCNDCYSLPITTRLPTYKLLQTFVVSYGGVSACAGFCTCDFNQKFATLTAQVVSENVDLTAEFFQKVILFELFYICLPNAKYCLFAKQFTRTPNLFIFLLNSICFFALGIWVSQL